MGNYRNFELATYFVAAGTASATEETLQRGIDFFQKHLRLDKVYLEPFRDGACLRGAGAAVQARV